MKKKLITPRDHFDHWAKNLHRLVEKNPKRERRSFKVGDKVEIMNPSWIFQEEQGTILKCHYGATLQSRQFGIIKSINGAYHYVQPVIKGKKIRRWEEEVYENELRHVNSKLNIFENKVRMFRHRYKGPSEK